MQMLEDTTMLYIVLLALAVGTTADSQDCVAGKAVEGKTVVMTFTPKQSLHNISDIRFKRNKSRATDIFTCDRNGAMQFNCGDGGAFKFNGTANNSVMVIIHNVTLDMTDLYEMRFLSNITTDSDNYSTCSLDVFERDNNTNTSITTTAQTITTTINNNSNTSITTTAQTITTTAIPTTTIGNNTKTNTLPNVGDPNDTVLQTMLHIVLPSSVGAVIILIIVVTLCCFRGRLKRLCLNFRPRSHSYLAQNRADMPDSDKTELGEDLENVTENLAKSRDSVYYEKYAKSPYPRSRHKRADRHEVSGKPLLVTSDTAHSQEDTTSELHEGNDKPLTEAYTDTASSGDTKHKPDERDDKPLLEASDTVNPSEDLDNNPYEDSDKPRPCGSSAVRLPGDIDNMPWYFGMIPKEEELRLLLSPANGHGSFMIRDSNSVANQYTLAVRFGYRVSCYRINQTEELSGFYIENGVVFPTLSDLVEYYIEHAGCLQDPLITPCKRNREAVYLDAV